MVNALSYFLCTKLSFAIYPLNVPIVMKSTTWCVLWCTMVVILWNPSSPRRLGYTRASSITPNGMKCKWSEFKKNKNKNVVLATGLQLLRCVLLIDLGPFLLFRITFPIPVGLLPLETILSLSLYGVLNQNYSNSTDSNKQHKGPDLLGKVTMPLFDFRR